MGVSLGRLIQGEFIVMFYGPILISLLFKGGLSAGGGHYHGFLRCTRGVTILLENMVIDSHYIMVCGTWQSLYTGIY